MKVTAPVVIANADCPECCMGRGVGCVDQFYRLRRFPHRRRYLAAKDALGIPDRAAPYSR